MKQATIKEIMHESKNERHLADFVEIGNCRNYRMEVLRPNQEREIYSIRSTSKEQARENAVKIISSMCTVYKEERLIWRMAGDRNWNFNTHVQTPMQNANRFFDHSVQKVKSLKKKVRDYFFMPEEN